MTDSDLHRSINASESGSSIPLGTDVLVVAARQCDADLLCKILTRAGYAPRWISELSQFSQFASSGLGINNMLATVLCHRVPARDRSSGPDIINLPSQLPNQLRGKRLIVVSDGIAEHTIVSLLDEGAHHCFHLREAPRVLQARLEAALRWHGRSTEKPLTHGDIVFDVQKRRVTRAGCIVELSPKEYELAYYLFSNRGRIVENGELLASIWSLPAGMDTRRIDTAACRVRKKLRLNAAQGWELKRLRQIGYRLVRTKESQQAVAASELLEEL